MIDPRWNQSYQAWHRYGDKPCFDLAWTFVDHPSLVGGRGLQSINVFLLDGSHPEPLSHTVCGTCGHDVRRKSLLLLAVPKVSP